MTNASTIEMQMLTSSLQRAIAHQQDDPQDLKDTAKTLMDWAHAGEAARREIYAAWRNKDNGATSSETF